ncbi:intraflagellar transport protein 43 homolog isoform X2 [Cylas formicarius]|uniref:intraflagellar transport protein 43 homolog isoform X2 n=1 Tax=Cylas formicarius TaxID=197179 RepID=UPI002958D8AE|nr:intraflagellar transport protein 43 homolog isoform X2 [Cylas formicarius]XP_060531285.1 intraflagellar transport protein 43 homolog isoform X2 [Cylas formicarius]XP_060531286.1 intraflagellar transport protein 43 homolog isoform X2 [Cylas formicarius]XP_060531287.1 intraflagellar transport protein 43 homolog isoform X2 [Cylas formicarius]
MLQSAAKLGRRSSNITPPSHNNDEILNVNDFENNPETREKPIQARTTGVWVDDGVKSAKTSRNTANIIELERFQSETKRDDDDIPEIPDIEDLQDDPLNLPDVKPVVTVDKSTYKELDNQLGNIQTDKINFGNLGNIDLSFLTNKLYPEKDVQSKPEIWTMESLFNELSRNN